MIHHQNNLESFSFLPTQTQTTSTPCDRIDRTFMKLYRTGANSGDKND